MGFNSISVLKPLHPRYCNGFVTFQFRFIFVSFSFQFRFNSVAFPLQFCYPFNPCNPPGHPTWASHLVPPPGTPTWAIHPVPPCSCTRVPQGRQAGNPPGTQGKPAIHPGTQTINLIPPTRAPHPGTPPGQATWYPHLVPPPGTRAPQGGPAILPGKLAWFPTWLHFTSDQLVTQGRPVIPFTPWESRHPTREPLGK